MVDYLSGLFPALANAFVNLPESVSSLIRNFSSTLPRAGPESLSLYLSVSVPTMTIVPNPGIKMERRNLSPDLLQSSKRPLGNFTFLLEYSVILDF